MQFINPCQLAEGRLEALVSVFPGESEVHRGHRWGWHPCSCLPEDGPAGDRPEKDREPGFLTATKPLNEQSLRDTLGLWVGFGYAIVVHSPQCAGHHGRRFSRFSRVHLPVRPQGHQPSRLHPRWPSWEYFPHGIGQHYKSGCVCVSGGLFKKF